MACLAESVEIKTYSNGNDVTGSDNFDNGVFTAVSSGNGFFAIALYQENELSEIVFSDNKEELNNIKLNIVIDNAQKYKMKVFRFDKDGTPLCINESLDGQPKDYKVYLNETFDNGCFNSGCSSVNGETIILDNGRVKLVNTSSNNPRFGFFNVPYLDNNIIIEADFELPQGASCFGARLISTYLNGPKPIAYMSAGGLKASASGNAPILVDDEIIESDGIFRISLKIDLESKTYDIYYNRVKCNATSQDISSAINDSIFTDGIDLIIPNLTEAGTIYVDNIRVYSGKEFADIGEERASVNKLDFKGSENMVSSIYKRPNSTEIAAKVLNSNHPRLLINSEKLQEIKNSDDELINEWKRTIIAKADEFVLKNTYRYALSTTGALADIDDSLDMMMHLGMAYMLTGDTKYPNRAYKEVEVLYNVPFVKKNGDEIPIGKRDFWNSKEYLDVSEISFIVSLCYDWMYDAWTAAQREEFSQNIFEKGLKRAYQSYYGELAPTVAGGTDWWQKTSNWNPVCNGGAFTSAIAFMEDDVYLCSNVAEAAVRALEYYLPSYAPSGAWAEGPTYWIYAMKYLTVICSTLDSVCGTDYGISKSEGLENSQFYALSCEGTTGVFNFGDSGNGHVNIPFTLYWAKKYNNPDIGGASVLNKNKYGFETNVFDLIYYDKNYVNNSFIKPLSDYYSGTELVTFASGHDESATTLAMTGGPGVATSHDHLDSGGVIAEKNGVRVLCDTGAENYEARSYFGARRYHHYKARPEGHNIFVINPHNLYTEDGASFYHGQSENAFSKVEYDEDEKLAVIDLSEAYSRDASCAKRKIYLEGSNAVIEDEITLKNNESLIEWYYHFEHMAKAPLKSSNGYAYGDGYCSYTVSDDKKSVVLEFKDFILSDKEKIEYIGSTKTFTLSFETSEDYEIEIRDAVRSSHDSAVIESLIKSGSFYGDWYNTTNNMKKIVVKMNNASGNVKLKAILW